MMKLLVSLVIAFFAASASLQESAALRVQLAGEKRPNARELAIRRKKASAKQRKENRELNVQSKSDISEGFWARVGGQVAAALNTAGTTVRSESETANLSGQVSSTVQDGENTDALQKGGSGVDRDQSDEEERVTKTK